MEKLESVKKADAAVKSMHDFTSPEVLYNELIASIKKYHPSTDITHDPEGIRDCASEAHNGPEKKVRGALYHPSAMRGNYSGRSGDWIRRPSLQDFFMMLVEDTMDDPARR